MVFSMYVYKKIMIAFVKIQTMFWTAKHNYVASQIVNLSHIHHSSKGDTNVPKTSVQQTLSFLHLKVSICTQLVGVLMC